MNEVSRSKVYATVRYEHVFIDRPFGFCWFNEDECRTKWYHQETFGM
ncbi:hypothetical protein DSM25559_1857 [Agrobacterium rosae]|uniref:Uncharacterized protein n=1 Tax=Agrobacterium rosae TaxID=1972867 RepID=A0A1R3TPL0_9HYPH|nr:hypothetical protein DSM25559_1857 [Agrobacterium rosae]